MPELKLAKLPDRTPVKLTISMSPDLAKALEEYARVYAQVHGVPEPVVELVPAMLTVFLESDRGFAKSRRPEKVPTPDG